MIWDWTRGIIDPTAGGGGPPGPPGPPGPSGTHGGGFESYSLPIGLAWFELASVPLTTVGTGFVSGLATAYSSLRCYSRETAPGAGTLNVGLYDSAHNLIASASIVNPSPGLSVLPVAAGVLAAGALYYIGLQCDRPGLEFAASGFGSGESALSWYANEASPILWPGGGPPDGYFDPFWAQVA